MPDLADTTQRERVHRFLRLNGRNSMSSLLLYEGIHHFFFKEIEGFTGYYDTPRILLCIGEPVCSESDYRTGIQEFLSFCRDSGKGCAFLMVTEQFKKTAEEFGFLSIQIGEDFIYDVQTYAPRGNHAKKVRSAINQVKKRGAVVREYSPVLERDLPLEKEFQEIAKHWIQSHRFQSKAYFIGLKFFELFAMKRYFYALLDGRIVAFLTCIPIYARNGYLFEDMIRDPSAPNGISELMVLEAIRHFKMSGKAMATFGVSPKLEVIRRGDLDFLSRIITNTTIKVINTFFRLKNLHHYRKKYHTSMVETCYLLKYPKRLGIRDVFGVLKTFNIVR
jgi:phosphatidylglycerol lysyltransferase